MEFGFVFSSFFFGPPYIPALSVSAFLLISFFAKRHLFTLFSLQLIILLAFVLCSLFCNPARPEFSVLAKMCHFDLTPVHYFFLSYSSELY